MPTIAKVGTPSSTAETPHVRTLPPLAFWTILVLGAVAGARYLQQVLDLPQFMLHLKDLSVYQIAGNRVLDGDSVYDTPLLGNTRGVWEFVYTPFSALLFVPLAGLTGDPYTWLGGFGNFAMAAGSVFAALSMLGYRRDARLAVSSVAVAGLLMWCEPIRQTMAFGQINIALLLLVSVDMALPDSSRLKGALTGIAAGIKLTPAFFVLYLLATRRYRAAGTAAGAFVATVALGFAAMPEDSLTFWSGAFADPARVGVPENTSNESLRGLLARAIGVDGLHQALWLLGALALTALCLYLARRLSLTGHELHAVALCGITSTAVSPFSWVHHWVWVAPLLIALVETAVRGRDIAAALLALVAAVIVSGGVLPELGVTANTVLDYGAHGDIDPLYRNAYLWLTIAVFAAGYLHLRRRTRGTQALDPKSAPREAIPSGSETGPRLSAAAESSARE
nr:glycosyltransferase 87 family protein [Nocardia bovistercoris]